MQRGKIASFIIVAFDMILAIVRLGVDAWPVAIGFSFILSLIWFPLFWTHLIPIGSGGVNGPRITKETPAGAIIFLGWVFLIGLSVLIVLTKQ